MSKLDCREVVDYLLTYLNQPDSHQAELEIAISHISDCPDCEQKVAYLIRALRISDEDILTCPECEELLPEYFQADKEGRTGEARWQSLTRHLDVCPACRAAYAVLVDLIALAGNEEETSFTTDLEPDLSFLDEKQSEPTGSTSSWQLDRLGRLIIDFSVELLRSWQIASPSPVGLKDDQLINTLYQGSITEVNADVAVTITVEARREDSQHCNLLVEVNILSRGGWPHLGGTEVILKQYDTVLEIQQTDSFGQVLFEAVPAGALPQLRLEITPDSSGL